MRRDEATLLAMARIYCAGNCAPEGKANDRCDTTGNSARDRVLRDGGTSEHLARTAHLRDDDGLCPDCASCIDYAIERTLRCPHEHKGNCEDCDIHCYAPAKRAQIRAIMAYAGPRMLTKHPIMAMRYLKKKLKKTPGNNRKVDLKKSPEDNPEKTPARKKGHARS